MSSTSLASPARHELAENEFTPDQWKLLTDAIMKDASEEEVKFFAQVCARTGLDPFKKQIHAVKRWNSEDRRMVWSYQTGIDGYRAIAARTGLYAGSEDADFVPQDERDPHPTKATVTVWKIVGGARVPFTASARWNEYVQTKRNGEPNSFWSRMPYGQLAKCAEALALRKAFPEQLSGVYLDEEMQQADSEGPQPHQKKRFDLESRPIPDESEPGKSEETAKPPEPPAGQSAKGLMPVPEKIAFWLGGKWKHELGDPSPDELTKYRRTGEPAAMASVIDEVRRNLVDHGMTEREFADIAMDHIDIGFPGELWDDPRVYPRILKLSQNPNSNTE